MLRPEQMSKVSVTGSKGVMDDVVETVHDCNLLHVTEYDGSWDGFQPGNPIDGAETASEKLVTVRSIESILDVDAEDAGPTRIVTDEALEEELGEIRDRVNDLEDRRDEIRTELGDVEEQIAAVEPFATLGIDLDLLSGYETLDVIVGEGKREAVERAVVDADGIDAVEIFSEDDIVAVFARPAETADDDVLTDALVGVDFTAIDVPDAEGAPEEYVAELEHRQQQLENKRRTVETELDEVKLDAAGFLLAAEEKLSIDVQKREVPLSFATTDNAFVAEGWIPTEEYTDFAASITDAVGDHAEVEELERASFTPDGDHHTEAVADGSTDAPDDTTEREAATDGGHAAAGEDDPPVVQNNGDAAGPFELLVQGFGRPKYSEFDPTLLVFLTFPLMFGFMIGDVGYGVLYAAIGYFLYANYDGTFREMGAVAIWAGLFTILFGIYFGIDVFGYHAYQLLDLKWEVGKGLSPADTSWALAWLTLSVLFGILHLNVGYALSFVTNLQQHDLKHTMYESGSWLLLLNGLWLWIFSKHLMGAKPAFLFDSVSVISLGAVSFTGLPTVVGFAGLAGAAVGFLLLAIGEPVEIAEALSPIVNVASYARIMAVLLAKGGMALAVNLLAFGAYIDDGGAGSFHFIFTSSKLTEVNGTESYQLVFAGLSPFAELTPVGIAAIAGAVIIAVAGHVVVLLLGITAAGIQGIRLEYVEFFGKFYEGGGDPYTPFGYDRQYTSEE